ncbi:hypothetical protein ACM66B_001449 [Microbotryomycetes sp. NB124-2]
MARHMADLSTSSEDEGIKPLKPSRAKENRAPEGATRPKQQTATQRTKATKAAKSTTSKANLKTAKLNNAAAVDDGAMSRDELDQHSANSAAEMDDDDVVPDTQYTQVATSKSKKAAVAAASKQQKKTTVAETATGSAREQRLQAKLDLKTKALEELQVAFDQLKDIRHTKAEESERQLTLIAGERQTAAYNMVELYKKENDELRREVEELRSGVDPSNVSATPRSAPDASRMTDMRRQLDALRAENEVLRANHDQAEQEKQAFDERARGWEKELQKTVKAKDEEAAKLTQVLQRDLAKAKKDLAVARQELEAETTHSKSLQAKLVKGSGSGAQRPRASLAPVVSDELELVKNQLALNEDLTGFTVASYKSEPDGEVYNCILNDYLGYTGGLGFKLVFREDETVVYDPDVNPERDAQLVKLLPPAMQRYMRFDATSCSEWFRQLFVAINNIQLESA